MKNVFAISFCAVISVAMLSACGDSYHYGYPRHGHPGHDRGWHHGPYHGGHRHSVGVDALATDDSSADEAGMSLADASAALAQDYSISSDAASKIIRLAAGEMSTDEISALGLGTTEAVALQNLEMPSQESIDTVAKNLGESSDKIGNIVADFVTDIRNERAQDANQ